MYGLFSCIFINMIKKHKFMQNTFSFHDAYISWLNSYLERFLLDNSWDNGPSFCTCCKYVCSQSWTQKLWCLCSIDSYYQGQPHHGGFPIVQAYLLIYKRGLFWSFSSRTQSILILNKSVNRNSRSRKQSLVIILVVKSSFNLICNGNHVFWWFFMFLKHPLSWKTNF